MKERMGDKRERMKTPENPITVAIGILNKRFETLSTALDAVTRRDSMDRFIETGIAAKESEGQDVDHLAARELLLRKLMLANPSRDSLPEWSKEYVEITSHLFNCLMMETTRPGAVKSYDSLESIVQHLEEIKDGLAKQEQVQPADPRLN